MTERDAVCRTCQQPIVWVRMKASGKNNPLNRQPVENGNTIIVGRSSIDHKLEAEPYLVGHHDASLPRYVSHFVTCPQREQHRRPDHQRAAPKVLMPEKWRRAYCPACDMRFNDIYPGARCGECFDRTTDLVNLREGEP